MAGPVPRTRTRPAETPEQRTARVAALRRAYVGGRLVPSFDLDDPGLDRLLDDLASRSSRRTLQPMGDRDP